MMSTPTPVGSSPAASGKAAGGRGYRSGARKLVVVKQPKFEGRCDDLKGFIYDCADARQADAYTTTTK
jgi:hypothetical protein